jgi:hypothetical protein
LDPKNVSFSSNGVCFFVSDRPPLSGTGRGDGKKAAEEVDAVMEMKGLLLKTLAKESPLTKKTVVVVDAAPTTSFELIFSLLMLTSL